ncbi:uncharacterized protein LJ264_002936 [Porphyrio hochstetteri]
MLPSKNRRKRRSSVSDAAPGAASAGETQALSSQPAVKRPRSSCLEEEMVQTDEMPCGTPLGNGTLSLWDKTAPRASPSRDDKDYMQPALGSTLLPRPPSKEQTRRGSSTPAGSKAQRLSCAAKEQGGKKYKHLLK